MGLPSLTIDEINRYSRHIALPHIGMRGQQQLKAARVLIVGLGGLGSPIALYLAAAGVGKLGLVDYDWIEISNLQRQVIYTNAQQGEYKAVCAANRLQELNPEIEIQPMTVEINSSNALALSAGYDILVDGTDNIPTRYLLNDLAVKTRRLFVYGSIFQFEGQLSVFGAPEGPCYRCLFPEPPPPESISSCSVSGVLGVQPGIIGSMQAAEVIKIITGMGEPLIGKLALFNALDMSLDRVNVSKRPACPVCGVDPNQVRLVDYEAWCKTGIQQNNHLPVNEWDISPARLEKQMRSSETPLLLDVREDFERSISSLPGAIPIPYPDLPVRMHELPKDRGIVVFCRNGVRSAQVVRLLISRGFITAKNLAGGINAWAEQIDPSIPVY